MLALAAINALAAAGFALAHAAGERGSLSRGALVVVLVGWFVAGAARWVRAETAAGCVTGLLARLGQMTGGLVLAVFVVPAAVLAPLFSLQEHLPSSSGISTVSTLAMVVLLKALVLMGLVNVTGALWLGVSAILRRWRRSAPDT